MGESVGGKERGGWVREWEGRSEGGESVGGKERGWKELPCRQGISAKGKLAA